MQQRNWYGYQLIHESQIKDVRIQEQTDLGLCQDMELTQHKIGNTVSISVSQTLEDVTHRITGCKILAIRFSPHNVWYDVGVPTMTVGVYSVVRNLPGDHIECWDNPTKAQVVQLRQPEEVIDVTPLLPEIDQEEEDLIEGLSVEPTSYKEPTVTWCERSVFFGEIETNPVKIARLIHCDTMESLDNEFQIGDFVMVKEDEHGNKLLGQVSEIRVTTCFEYSVAVQTKGPARIVVRDVIGQDLEKYNGPA